MESVENSIFTTFLCAYKQKNRLDRRFLLCYARLKGHNALNMDILTYLPRVVNLSTKKRKEKRNKKHAPTKQREYKNAPKQSGKGDRARYRTKRSFWTPCSARFSRSGELRATRWSALSAETVKGAGSCPRNSCAALPQRRRISEAIIQNEYFV